MVRILKPDEDELRLASMVLDCAPSAVDIPNAPARLSQIAKVLVDFAWWSVTGGAFDPEEPFLHNNNITKYISDREENRRSSINSARLELNSAIDVDGYCEGSVSLNTDKVYKILERLYDGAV